MSRALFLIIYAYQRREVKRRKEKQKRREGKEKRSRRGRREADALYPPLSPLGGNARERARGSKQKRGLSFFKDVFAKAEKIITSDQIDIFFLLA